MINERKNYQDGELGVRIDLGGRVKSFRVRICDSIDRILLIAIIFLTKP